MENPGSGTVGGTQASKNTHDKHNQPVFDRLTSMRDTLAEQGLGGVEQANVDTVRKGTAIDDNLEQGECSLTLERCASSEAGQEKAEIHQTLHDMSGATGEIDHLDSTTWLAQEVTCEDRHNLPALNCLSGTMITGTGGQTKLDKGQLDDAPGVTLDTDDVQNETAKRESKFLGMSTHEIETIERLQTLQSIFETTNKVEYLEEAISLAEGLVVLAPSSGAWTMLLDLLKKSYQKTGRLEDLTKVIGWSKKAVAAIPLDHADRGALLAGLGTALLTRYDQLGALEDLEQAIKHTEGGAEIAPPHDPIRPAILSSLGVMFGRRYERFGAVEDLHRAIAHSTQAMIILPPDNPERARILSNLCTNLSVRYDRFGAPEDLLEATRLAEEAVAAAPLGHIERAGKLNNMGALILKRFERFGDLAYLDEAIRWTEEAVAATPVGDTKRAGILNNLGAMLNRRYDRLGTPDDLAKAIKWTQESVATTSPGDPARAGRLNNLGSRLSSRYNRFGAPADLAEAIKYAQEAVAATPLGDPRRGARLRNLSARISSRYDRFGALDDLAELIKCAEEAVAITPPEDTNRAELLSHLGAMLNKKYTRLGIPDDLAEAIKQTQEAVAVTPPDDPRRAGRLGNLGGVIWSRYNRFGAPDDLVQAIRLTNEAAEAAHLKHEGILVNLGIMIFSKYMRFGVPEDLAEAIKWTEEGVAANTREDHSRALALGSLVVMISRKYCDFGEPGELQETLKRAEAALASILPDEPHRAEAMIGMIDLVKESYRLTGSFQDFNYILRLGYEVWHGQMYPPNSRIHAALRVVGSLTTNKMWQESSSLFGDVVKLLPHLSPRSIGRSEQEYKLATFSTLTAKAVSVASQAGEEPSHCLRLLELGRGIILGLVIDCRSDLSELFLKHPEVATKYDNLRREIDTPLVTIVADLGSPVSSYQSEHRRRQQAVDELKETLLSIRELPGFEAFQLAPRSEDLMAMASEGPIVLFNSTEYRSDAIIVTRSAIKALRLPTLTYSSVEDRMSQITRLVRGKRCTYQSRNERMKELLLWLWDVAVEPVLQLILPETPAVADGRLPRVWWIGVGPLAKAPFHAAGDHSPGSTRNTLSRVISSYIPTIKALSFAREKKLELLEDSRLLLVTMPTTPGADPLGNAIVEAEDIASVVKGKLISAQLNRPSTAQVMAELPSSHAVHFACHGVSDAVSPSDSHLLLRECDGSEAGVQDKLTVGMISGTKIDHAQIAYLSACSTAENSSAQLHDESIYIAGGFQLAGYSHVLATQWVSNDGVCLQVAGDFYRKLFSGQPNGGVKDHSQVSAAFHHAVKRLRDGNWKHPIKWASFIHTGA